MPEFNLIFWIFFAFVLFALHFLGTSPQRRVWLMLLSSGLFYVYFDFWHFPVVFALGCATFFASKLWVRISLLLVVFLSVKFSASYWGFSIPLGLSYIFLQWVGFSLDKRDRSGQLRVSELLASGFFFPAVSAGPILNSRHIILQLRTPLALDSLNFRESCFLIINGLFKKNIGDQMAGVDWSNPWEGWLSVVRLSARFYADFSGYTDIVRGLALLIGVRMPENFRIPYVAESISEHWRRWHISLYEWFKSYLFVPFVLRLEKSLPLGSKHRGKFFEFGLFVGLLLITLLVGLWHGFGGNFILWGLLNGVLVWASPIFLHVTASWRWRRVLRILITFFVLALLRIFIVTPTIHGTVHIWGGLFFWSQVRYISSPMIYDLCSVVFALLIPHGVDAVWLLRGEKIIKFKYFWLMIAVFLYITILLSGNGRPIIYGQF